MTFYWFAVIRLTRLACRLAGHRWSVTAQHGYAVRWCGRCWGYTLERLP